MEKLEESTWFEIFRTGVWHGTDYNKEHLAKIVKNFESGDPKVPLIIGHNGFCGEEKPALGWVKELKVSGNRLLAKARNVAAELVSAVNEERYPMRSIELWNNYQGRGVALGAIAFLGGNNPEVGGMADFKFSRAAGEDDGYMLQSKAGDRVCFAYGSTEKMVAVSGQETTTHHQKGEGEDMTKEEIEKLARETAEAAVLQFKSGPEFSALVTENQQLKTQVAEATQFAASVSAQAETEKCLTFAKSLLDQKKITPAVFNAGLGGFLASLDNREELEFSAGKKATRRAFAMELLNTAPGNTALFNKVDTESPRAGEDEDISADVQAFAAKNGLDPKIVQANFAAARQGGIKSIADGDEDQGMQAGVSASLFGK